MDRLQRKPIIVANWKMHKSIASSIEFVHALAPKITVPSTQVFIAPSFTALHAVAAAAKPYPAITVGAQNMYAAAEGAYTGEVSGIQLVDAGAQFVILGHSERRKLCKETDQFINEKVKIALLSKLIPILCVGESFDERKAGKSEEVVGEQLKKCLNDITSVQGRGTIIAYEPVWAIGTNCAATPPMVQEMHQFCRDWLIRHWGDEAANKVHLIYGGSVKPDNALSLMQQKDVDGLLVGGASLAVESFSEIVNFDLGET
jgi:triosephosphate isomerase